MIRGHGGLGRVVYKVGDERRSAGGDASYGKSLDV